MQKSNRLRFAPSPTGDLHVGGARVALFNWLYAKKTGGKFLLRIEDTDVERSSEQAFVGILESLTWLGLGWDEEPIRQSQRGELYRKAVQRLLDNDSAYRCFCTKEELEVEREQARLTKSDYHYSGKCRYLTAGTIARYVHEGKAFTARFRVPDGNTEFDDYVHGVTTFQNETIGDFIVARSDGSPVYILGVAVDDADMGITLVMRGDDHISNTPKQIMLMQALGYEIPRFAHLPQVLGSDKKKLSKRHGAASILEYKRLGFLPQAVVNFLAFLGWNPGDDREKMGIPELIESFSLEGISKKSSVFDIQKLEWLNGQYIYELSPEKLFEYVSPLLIDRGLLTENELKEKREYAVQCISLLRERCRLLTDFADNGAFFFQDPAVYEEAGVKKYFREVGTITLLETVSRRFENLEPFNETTTENVVREQAEAGGLSASKLIHPVRLAVTGLTYGPGLFEILHVLGKERVVSRLHQAVLYIKSLV